MKNDENVVAPLTFRKVLSLRGPNIWANFPVLEAWVDLAELKDSPSDEIPGFNDRLMSWLPSLIEHRCSEGTRGGFFERLRRGTYQAHILEHVTLELQTLAGTEVGYGRARELDEEGVYRVAVEYGDETVGRAALETARRLCLAAVYDQPFNVPEELAKLREIVHRECLGPSTRAIVKAATDRGIPTMRLNRHSLVQLGYGTKQRRIMTAESDRTGAIAESIAQDKELTRKLLDAAGVPVPKGRPVESADDAWETALDLGVPVVVKPQYGNHGRGVTTNLYTREEVVAAYHHAHNEESTIMVERYVEGSDFRLLIVGNRLVAAAQREPAQVVGDGQHSIRDLIEIANRDPRRSDGHATVMSFITLDPVAESVVAQQGFTPDSVPNAGQIVLIRRNGNLSTGGTAQDVTALVHRDVAARAVDAARVIGLDIAGIDIIAKDISLPLEVQGGTVVEVNASPGLRMHLQPSIGQPQPVGQAIVELLYPAGETGRIPVVAVTGVNGKTTTTRLISHILFLQGHRVGMASTDGVFLGERRIDDGDCSGPQSARRILMNPNIDAAVLETARGGILREGLGFDRCDVAVVTNIGDGDHLGISNIDTLEQLAQVKRCIVDVVATQGVAVLNGDDARVAEMAAKCPGSVLFFAHSGDNACVMQQREAGGRAAYVQNGSLILAHGRSEFALINLDRVPLTHGGKIRFQIENALAAAAATWALGVPAETIRAGLESFSPSMDTSPGRFNLLEYHGATVVVDYGHNPSALRSVLDAIANFPATRRTAVYSAAGDRRDDDMIRQGQMLGQNFDRVVLYEGDYVRGRQPGEITQRLRDGMANQPRVQETLAYTSWKLAVEFALSEAQPGELVLVQADAIDESVEFFRSLLVLQSTPTK